MDHRSGIVLAALAWLVVGCGEAVAPPPPLVPATLAELRGPWRAEPLLLDSAFVGRLVEVCAETLQIAPGRAAIADARGLGVATIRMTGKGAGGCNMIEITQTGEVLGSGAGWSQDAPETVLPLRGNALGGFETQTVEGHGLQGMGWSIYGRAGDAISAVQVVPAGREPVTATLANGWFAAWWPAAAADPSPNVNLGFLIPPFVVRGLDAAGNLLNEVRP